jgi:Zn-finger nucleic acid-binding protein
MKCPNDRAEMKPVGLQSSMGRSIVVDQCPECGGIWFDEFEIYQAKDGEARRIETLDRAALANPAQLAASALICPRDGVQLVQFNDAYFPKGIIIANCRRCSGFWLNRGEFIKYQEARRGLRRPREIVIEDTAFENDVERVMSMHRSNPADNPVFRAARFLSTPVDQMTLPQTGPSQPSPTQENIGALVGVLMTVLRLFVLR